MAREILAFTTALGLDSFDLLGFSIGSMVAQRVALARPTAVGKVVLASTAPEGAAGLHNWDPNVTSAIGGPQTTAEGYLSAQCDAVARWGVPTHAKLEEVTGLTMPVFVANGDSDRLIPTKCSYLIAGLIPNATIKIYPDAAHGFLFQHHEQFAADVLSFLDAAAPISAVLYAS